MKHPVESSVPRIKHDRAAVLHFIVDYKRAHDGNSPTLREIMAGCGITSKSVASYAVQALAKSGLVRLPAGCRGRGVARGIEVIGGRWQWSYEEPVEVR